MALFLVSSFIVHPTLLYTCYNAPHTLFSVSHGFVIRFIPGFSTSFIDMQGQAPDLGAQCHQPGH